MSGECDTCRHRNVPFDVDPCRSCIRHRSDGGDGWEPAEPPASGCPADGTGPTFVGFPESRPEPAAPPEIAARVAELEAACAPSTHDPAAPPAPVWSDIEITVKHPTFQAGGGGSGFSGSCPAAPPEPPGVKLDGEKTRWDLLPWPALEIVAQAFTQGASKYSDYGWKTLPDARRRYFAAAIRHAVAWLRGEKLDPESGLPHLAHLVCNGLFLLSFDLDEAKPPAGL